MRPLTTIRRLWQAGALAKLDWHIGELIVHVAREWVGLVGAGVQPLEKRAVVEDVSSVLAVNSVSGPGATRRGHVPFVLHLRFARHHAGFAAELFERA